ncbi:MAG: uroporphyrinogen decarboxylase family protein [Kiritimatiellae bacterium]|nr:uroporphyrinogen decarboxylase family protein [Kiritimatiellia bacterium]
MTARQRMLIAMRNGIPDRVPVAPDMSYMIPCRLTGKPFWDIFLYNDPPVWRAYMDAVAHFGTDGWLYSMDGFRLEEDAPTKRHPDEVVTQTVIVERNDERIVTRSFSQRKGEGPIWHDWVTVYPRFDPPTALPATKVGLEAPPSRWWPIEGVKPMKKGLALLQEGLDYFRERGVIGTHVPPPMLGNPTNGVKYTIYDYYDCHDETKKWSESAGERIVAYLKRLLAAPVRPDFILTGGSGMLVFGTPDTIRELSLPTIKEITRLCKEAGMPSQIHCCGPERALIRMCAEETDLNSINPLEIRPMGDCDLAEVKQAHGAKLSLMGNLHTTDIMLRGSVKDVRRESLKTIRAAGEGGGFILSTGDQCGRDTPDENIREMVRVVEEFGRYPLDMAAIERELKSLG